MPENDVILKLKLEKHPRKLLLNLPDGVTELARLVFDREPNQPPYDLVMAFVFTLPEMAAVIRRVDAESLLQPEGRLYLMYPKKGNKTYKEWIGRDDIFPFLNVDEETGIVSGTKLKFNSMAAFSETFTVIGLKPVVEKAKRTKA